MLRSIKSEAWRKTIWFVIGLVAADVAATVCFPLPPDADQRPSSMQLYFNYGLSTEYKLQRQLGPDRTHQSQLAGIGWARTEQELQAAREQLECRSLRIAAYGQSFTKHVLDELEPLMPEASFVFQGGPDAPLNHSYARYLEERSTLQADVVIVGIVATSVPGITTMTHMTRNFEVPFAYTFPRYRWNGTSCDEVIPLVTSCDDWRETLQDPGKHKAWMEQLQQHDEFFRARVYRATVFDRLTSVRLLRRAWGQRALRDAQSATFGPHGFHPDSEAICAGRWMIEQFAQRVRGDGAVPVVLLFNSRDCSDYLYRAFAPLLESHSIPYLSTHELAPAEDRSNYIADGHFTPEVDREFAAALRQCILQTLPSQESLGSVDEWTGTTSPIGPSAR